MNSLLYGLLSPDNRPTLGPFGITQNPSDPSSFTPSGSEWTAAQAVYTATSGTGYVWKADPASLRLTSSNQDGVTAGQSVGYANNYRNVGDDDSAAKETGDRRCTYNVVDGVGAFVFTGAQDTTDNQRLALPIMDMNQGTWVVVARLADTTNANQTVFECGPFRIMAQMSGYTGPTVRVGGGIQIEFGLTSMYERWTTFVVQINKSTGKIRLIYDQGSWVEDDVLFWLDAPAATYEQENYMARNYYDLSAPYGAPMNGAIHSVVYIDQFTTLDTDDIQDLVDLALMGTSLTFTVPSILPPTGPTEEGYIELINVSNSSELTAALSEASPGDDIVLADGTYSGNFTLSANGTVENPIRIRAENVGGALMTGLLTLSGDNTRGFGLKWDSVSGSSQIVLLSGDNVWLQRCYFIDCNVGTFGGSVNRGIVAVASPADSCIVEYCEFSGWETYSAIKFRTASTTGCTNCIARYNYLHDTALSQALSHGGDGTRAGTDHMSGNAFISNYIYNVKSSSGIAIQIKGSGVTVEQNTVINSGYCFNRHGYNCIWRSNTMINSGGPWVCGKGHQVIGNYNNKAGTYTSIGCSTGTQTMDAWTPSGSNQPVGENILFAKNEGPLNLQMWNLSSHTLNSRNSDIEAHSGSISYGSSAISRTPTLPTYTTSALSVAVPTRVALTQLDVGPMASGAPSLPPTVQEVYARPFSSESAFNRPIGTGATFSSTPPFSGYTDGTVADNNVFSNQSVLSVSDPVANFTWSGALSGVGLPFSIKFPSSGFPTYTTDTTFDCVATVVDENYTGHDIYKIDTRSGVRKAAIHREFDIRGLGHGLTAGFGNRVGSSAAGNAVFAGTIRKAEFETPGYTIGHAHHIALPWVSPAYINNKFQLPAVCHDGFGETNNPSAPCAMGELLAIRSSDLAAVINAINALGIGSSSKEVCIRYATAFCHYGIYVTDSAGQISFRADAVLDSTLKADFITFIRNILWTYLYRVTNSVTGATGTITTGAVLTGSAGTLTYPAGGGTALAANRALV